ncbi:hypothetical protein K2X33_05235 [bacterium]|nr:hypothetical protein [bacterium]
MGSVLALALAFLLSTAGASDEDMVQERCLVKYTLYSGGQDSEVTVDLCTVGFLNATPATLPGKPIDAGSRMAGKFVWEKAVFRKLDKPATHQEWLTMQADLDARATKSFVVFPLWQGDPDKATASLITTHLTLLFKDEEAAARLPDLETKWAIKQSRKSTTVANRFTAELGAESKFSPLEVANRLYDTQLFSWVQPVLVFEMQIRR